MAKKDQKFASGIDDEISIFNKGSAFWTSLKKRGIAQEVLGKKDIDLLEIAIKYCDFVYTSLYPKQVKDIVAVLGKLNDNGIE